MLYTAIYEDSTEAAFHAAAKSGLRIIMGKMMMDVGSYGQLQPTKIVSISLHESERLCKTWHGAKEGLIEYAFSPRFAVACSEKLMRGAAELAAKYGAYLQTHLAENREEIEKVRHQFTWAQDYTRGLRESAGCCGSADGAGPLPPLERPRTRGPGRGGSECRTLPQRQSFPAERHPAFGKSAGRRFASRSRQ